jgi:predicted RecB family nuclease
MRSTLPFHTKPVVLLKHNTRSYHHKICAAVNSKSSKNSFHYVYLWKPVLINVITKSKTLRTCEKGHEYYKSSDCPTCPVCEKERKPKDNFLSLLAAPARRALENNNITTLKQLAKYSEADILKFHGMGASSIPKLKKALQENGLNFKTR